MRFLASLTLAAVALSGCGRTGIGLERISEPGTEEVDAGGAPDLGCEPTLQVASLTRLPVQDPFATLIPSAQHVTYLSNEEGVGRLRRFDLIQGRSNRIADGTLELIDATAHRTLFTITRDGQDEVQIEEDGRFRTLSTIGHDRAPTGPSPKRQISGPFVGYCTGSGSSIEVHDLETGDHFGSLAQEGVPCNEPLFMDGRFVAHLGPARNALNAIVVYQADFSSPLPTVMVWGVDLAMPTLFKLQIYYLDEGHFTSKPVSYVPDTKSTRLSDALCTSVHASGSGVVAACGTESRGWPYAPTTEILYHDGEALRSLRAPAQDGRVVLLPRIGDGFVTWLAYDNPDDLCGGQRERPAGHVMVAALPDGPPVEVAPIDAPCLCCDALLPEPMLAARDDTIVWNYYSGGEGLYGAARIVLGCD